MTFIIAEPNDQLSFLLRDQQHLMQQSPLPRNMWFIWHPEHHSPGCVLPASLFFVSKWPSWSSTTPYAVCSVVVSISVSNNSIFPGAQAINLKVKFNSSHFLIFHFQPDWTYWLYLQHRSRCRSYFTIFTAPTLVQARAHLQGLIHNLTDFPASTLAPVILHPVVRVMPLSQISMPGFCWPHPEVFMCDNAPSSSSSFTLS